MLAKLAESLPIGDEFLYEPKWDGFRAIVFRGGGDVYIQSRDLRPLDRYFPELHAALVAQLPDRSVIDGEILIVTSHGPAVGLLPVRLDPAAASGAQLSGETRASAARADA